MKNQRSDQLPLMMQKMVLRLHAAINRSGILASVPGQWFFETAYLFYKRFFEARGVGALRQWIPPGSWVIDVGANIGFFTVLFADWIEGEGRVVALEPELINYKRLQRRMARHPRHQQAELLNVAAAETDGQGFLQLNPDHPADHRLATAGMPIHLVSLDTLMENRGCPRVGLIKIDVQGAENRVLMGGERLIRRHRPALFVELTLNDPGSLETMALLSSWNYASHWIHANKIVSIETNGIENILRKKGYMDCLYLPHPQTSSAQTLSG